MPFRKNTRYGRSGRRRTVRGWRPVLSGPSASVTGRHFAFDCGETVGLHGPLETVDGDKWPLARTP